jgi:uncharacterized protein YjbI with pentapeptide repeats
MWNLDRARGWAFIILWCTASSVTAQDRETCINPVGFTLDATALTQAVTEHAKWVFNSQTGARAILCRLEAKALDLRALDLRGIDLRLSKLGHADFSGARLDGAQFKFADLRQASFRKVSLHKANFYRANLEGVEFSASKGQNSSCEKPT